MAKAIAIVLVFVVSMESANGLRDKMMTSNATQTLDYLLASNRYDKRLRPGFGARVFINIIELKIIKRLSNLEYLLHSKLDEEIKDRSSLSCFIIAIATGSPITISVNFFIKSMGPVSDNDQSFALDCYFRQHWYDLRLQYQKFPGLEEFSMSWLFLDRVWKPDTYFVNGKKSFLHRITVPNKFLRLRHDGFITYSMRLTISTSCPMYLRKFPLDTQRCPLVLGSYGYTNKDLIYRWTNSTPIGLQQGVEIAQFDLTNITWEDEKIMIKGGLSYSTVQANFLLKRHTGYFMLQVYIPCGLIVVCSWISFWIDPEAVPARVYVPCGLIVLSSWVSFWIDPDDVAARVALGVTTVLSLTTMGFGGRAQMPKVSYWTALDWFVIICFTSVFSVMIEYAIVNFMDKITKDIKKMIQSKKKENDGMQKAETQLEKKQEQKPLRKKDRSASFSCAPSKPEDKVKMQTTAQVETQSSNILKNFPKQLPTVVAYLETPKSKIRSKSIPNLSLGREKSEEEKITPKIIIRTFDENLIDFETEVEPIEVVLNVEEDIQWEAVEDSEEKKRAFINFFKNVRRPKELWEKIKILPGQTDIINSLESSEPPNKFSKIDVKSRRNFPIAFLLSLIVYLFAFTYYLTDDIPVRDSDLNLRKQ